MSIVFALITFYSCSPELEHLEPVTQQDRDIHAAKLWFEENQGEISSVIHEGTHSLRISKEPYVKNPNWGLVNKHVNADGQVVIEVNLTFNKSMAPNAFLEKTTEKDQSPIMLQNLLLTSDGKGGYDTYLLKIFAFSDKNVKNKKALFQSLNYGHLEKGFSGSILLTSYQEELFKRWEFSDGFLISEAKPIPDSHKRQERANFSYSCEIVDTSYCEVESDGIGYGATVTCGGGLEYQCTFTDSPSSPGSQLESLDPDSGGGGGGGGSGELLDPLEEEEEDLINDLENPCASAIFDNLTHINLDNITSLNGTNVNITQLVLNLFKQSGKFDYIVKEGGEFKPGENAFTRPPKRNQSGRYEIITEFNPAYFNKATQLSITRTMIHESIHAYLLYEQRANPYDDPYDAIRSYSISNNITDPNILHHEFMPAYIEAMALSLQQWDRNYGDGGNHGWQYYKDMAWGGLTHHDIDGTVVLNAAFEANHPNTTERNRVLNIINNEAENSPNSKGTPCN